jgi:hypothetical protein
MLGDYKKMRFRNCIIDKNIDEAVKIANSILTAGSSLVNELSNKDDFQYNSGHGTQVALNLILVREPVNVYSYKSINPFTKAIGYFDGEAIWINLRKLPLLTKEDVIGLLLHEYAHYCGYKHGNNFKSEHKCKHSVPYYLSENVKRWI